MLYETVEGARTVNPQDSQTIAPVQIGNGVRLAAVMRLHTQGAPEQTGRPLDLAIEGDGFFQVQKPDGTTAYTRDGSFSVSDTGSLVTNGGYKLAAQRHASAGRAGRDDVAVGSRHAQRSGSDTAESSWAASRWPGSSIRAGS